MRRQCSTVECSFAMNHFTMAFLQALKAKFVQYGAPERRSLPETEARRAGIDVVGQVRPAAIAQVPRERVQLAKSIVLALPSGAGGQQCRALRFGASEQPGIVAADAQLIDGATLHRSAQCGAKLVDQHLVLQQTLEIAAIEVALRQPSVEVAAAVQPVPYAKTGDDLVQLARLDLDPAAFRLLAREQAQQGGAFQVVVTRVVEDRKS